MYGYCNVGTKSPALRSPWVLNEHLASAHLQAVHGLAADDVVGAVDVVEHG
jgi:hypothetical protein